MLSIDVEYSQLAKIDQKLKSIRGGAPNALKLAVNDTARKTRTSVSQAVRKTYLIKAKDFKSFESIQYATKSKLSATLDVKSPVLSAYKYFRVSPNTMGKGRYFNPTLSRYQTGKGGRSARVKVMKSGGLKSITVSTGSGELKGFIAEMKNNEQSKHVGVFQRTEGKKRGEKGEIKEILALSAANMVYNKKAGAYDENMQKDMQKYLLKQINRQIERALKK